MINIWLHQHGGGIMVEFRCKTWKFSKTKLWFLDTKRTMLDSGSYGAFVIVHYMILMFRAYSLLLYLMRSSIHLAAKYNRRKK
jgi:hypothetical protein